MRNQARVGRGEPLLDVTARRIEAAFGPASAVGARFLPLIDSGLIELTGLIELVSGEVVTLSDLWEDWVPGDDPGNDHGRKVDWPRLVTAITEDLE